MTPAIDRLKSRLDDMGATLVSSRDDGPSSELTYHLAGLVVSLVADYGDWRVNIGRQGGLLYPASFWVRTLDGGKTYPDPPVTPEDLPKVTDRLAELLSRVDEVSATVAGMGEQYSKAMRERLQ